MIEWKRCPFCACKNWLSQGANHYRCSYCGAVVSFSFLDYRPIEDELNKRIDELTADLAALREQVRWIPYSTSCAPAANDRYLVKLANDWVCCATYYLEHQKDGNCQWKWKDDRAQEIISVRYWKGLEE